MPETHVWIATVDAPMPAWSSLRRLLANRDVGHVTAVMPGVLLFANDPALQVLTPTGLDDTFVQALSNCLAALHVTHRRLDAPVQLYRQLDPHGRFTRDQIQPPDADPIPGQVLLTSIQLGPQWCAPPDADTRAETVTHRQRNALGDHDRPLPVDWI